jgi:hypothetical protein
MRLLGILAKIHMRHDGSGHSIVEGMAKSQALKYAVELFRQYTWNFEGRANQLLPPTVLNHSFRPIPILTFNTANETKALGARYGYYAVELSGAALSMAQHPTQEATEATNRQMTSRQPTISVAGLQQHPQASVPIVTHPCLSCRNSNRDGIGFFLPVANALASRKAATTPETNVPKVGHRPGGVQQTICHAGYAKSPANG